MSRGEYKPLAHDGTPIITEDVKKCFYRDRRSRCRQLATRVIQVGARSEYGLSNSREGDQEVSPGTSLRDLYTTLINTTVQGLPNPPNPDSCGGRDYTVYPNPIYGAGRIDALAAVNALP